MVSKSKTVVAQDQELKQQLLSAVGKSKTGTRISSLGDLIRKSNADVKDTDIKALVLPMIMSGKLKYTPELKITLAKTRAKAHR